MNRQDLQLIIIIGGATFVYFLRKSAVKHVQVHFPQLYPQVSSARGWAKFVFGRQDRSLNDPELSAKVNKALVSAVVLLAGIVIIPFVL